MSSVYLSGHLTICFFSHFSLGSNYTELLSISQNGQVHSLFSACCSCWAHTLLSYSSVTTRLAPSQPSCLHLHLLRGFLQTLSKLTPLTWTSPIAALNTAYNDLLLYFLTYPLHRNLYEGKILCVLASHCTPKPSIVLCILQDSLHTGGINLSLDHSDYMYKSDMALWKETLLSIFVVYLLLWTH